MNEYKIFLDRDYVVIVKADEVQEYEGIYIFRIVLPNAGSTNPARVVARFSVDNVMGYVLVDND